MCLARPVSRQSSELKLEFDHVFVCAPRTADDAVILENAGLRCGMNQIHAGQGTANANFYFDNAYLGCDGRSRALVHSVSPCGHRAGARLPECLLGNTPRHFAAGDGIRIVTRGESDKEPLVFFSLASVAPVDYPPEQRVPLLQKGKRRRLKNVHIQTTTGSLSHEL